MKVLKPTSFGQIGTEAIKALLEVVKTKTIQHVDLVNKKQKESIKQIQR